MVYNYSFHTCLFFVYFWGDYIPDKERARVTKKNDDSNQDFSGTLYHKKKIDSKETKEMLYQTTCLLVVGSPSFWNAPNST